MQEQDLLSQLKDIHFPNDIGFQMAWGWWFLLVLILLFFIFIFVFFIRFLKKRRLKNNIKKQLDVLFEGDNNLYVECSILLRRYAHYLYPEIKINNFDENKWVDFLDEKLTLSAELKKMFLFSIYQKEQVVDKKTLLNYSKKWIDYV